MSERVRKVQEMKLCFSCLVKGHQVKDCKSKRPCAVNNCKRTHHKLLHTDPPVTSAINTPLDSDSILPVVRVTFRSQNSKLREGNVLVDGGAGTTIIRKDFAKALGLQGNRERLDLSLVGCKKLENFNSRRLKFWVSSLRGGEEFEIEAYEVDKTVLSVQALDRAWLNSFSHLRDIDFSHKAGPIDLILGVQYSHLHAEDEVRQGLPFEPLGKRTKLGWYAMGPDKTQRVSPICSVNFVEKVDLEKFYNFETVGIQSKNCDCPRDVRSKDDLRALELMEETCRRDGDRYEIGLPWKKDPSLLHDNYQLAERRLYSLEKNLMKNDTRAKMYNSAIQEYEMNRWAEKIDVLGPNMNGGPVYYLPHHGVYRPDKPSTPLRVVFDPACEYKGVSMNSFLYKGPGLLGNLLSILLRFREERIAIVGDISKMYLQIKLKESDTHLHRFLWRDLDTTRAPDVYRLLRVTFGDKPSPDMASYVMLRIAREHKDEYSEAATIVERDRYMDDLIHSCETSEQALKRINDVDTILETGKFRVKEWYCSSEVVRQQMALEKCGKLDEYISLDGEEIKTLGVRWNPVTDKLGFVVKNVSTQTYTKRTVLSVMSRLYDPLGLASSVTIKARMAMQDIWRDRSLDWDDKLPEGMCELWKGLFEELKKLDDIQFPRCLKPIDYVGQSTLHVFADASMGAYGAVAYLTWLTKQTTSVQLVMAKARVAPLRHTTIPRLELMAALIASRLAKTICDEFKEKPSEVILWTDSQVVLNWIKSDSLSFKMFVGVRVGEIQSTWDPEHWRYVPTALNPADDLSRGVEVTDMNGRWMHGPSFLKLPVDDWPVKSDNRETVDDNCEKRKSKIVAQFVQVEPFIEPEKFSCWQRLLRVTAYCLRFVQKLQSGVKKVQMQDEDVFSLDCEDIEKAETYWFKTVQLTLSNWEKDYVDLAPFMENGVIRVGGRLRHSPLSYDQVHPILLPKGHHVSRLIMRAVHVKMGHTGPERTLCESRRLFWIVRGRNLAKDIVRHCVVCRKLRQPGHTTLMADLPPERLLPFSPAFSVTGVDLFGPFLLKYGRNKTSKAWGAIFTCANVRAIHLEIVDGLSTQAFLQALRRFAATHGWPEKIISDNGTSFVGTERELRSLVVEGRKQLCDFAVLHKVKWLFITPLSPHQGGLYESLIKQVKQALKVSIGQQILTWNEMCTAFAEVKCLINSRPLCYTVNDANDPQPLTPNHFLLGRASSDIPQGPYQETKNLHKRFEYIQMLVNQTWKRFLREYMPTLMKRSKWQVQGRQLKCDDIVLLVDFNAPRGKWDLARIIEVYPGKDGIVRNVRVRTKNGQYNRSVQKCCPILEA